LNDKQVNTYIISAGSLGLFGGITVLSTQRLLSMVPMEVAQSSLNAMPRKAGGLMAYTPKLLPATSLQSSTTPEGVGLENAKAIVGVTTVPHTSRTALNTNSIPDFLIGFLPYSAELLMDSSGTLGNAPEAAPSQRTHPDRPGFILHPT
jgi:hypothetical protein